MAFSPLESLRENVSYDPLSGLFTVKKVVGRKVREGDNAYIKIQINGRTYSAHRLAWYLYYGREPREGYEIDHINGDKGDNRIENLRELTHAQNIKACKQRNYERYLNTTGE